MSNDMHNSSSYMPVGTTLQSGKYRIESHLASGGFGNTYKAKHLFFDEIVAIKEFYIKGVTHRDAETQDVSVSNADNEPMFIEQKQKFLKEAKRIYKLSKLGCGNIVDVRDFFEENGTAYYVMGYIEGKSLSKKVKDAMPFCRLSQQEVYGYVVQILDALEVVHEKHLFHLDLKPGNVMIDKDGKAILIDFGASKQTNPDGGEATRTALPYTPGYAPLEQIEQDLDNIGTWSDLYSLGATIYYALTGKTPPKPTKLIQEGESALKFDDDITGAMRELVTKLMKPYRRDRFQTVEEVRQWLGKNIKKPEKLPGGIESVVDDDDSTQLINLKKPVTPKKPEPSQKPAPLHKSEPQKKSEPSKKDDDQITLGKPEPSAPSGNTFSPLLTKLLSIKSAMIAGVALILALLGIWGVKKCGSSPEEPTTVAVSQQEVTTPAIVENMKASNSLGDYLYSGPIDTDSLPHGKGEAIFTNSSTAKSYKGPFVHGVMDGSDAEYLFQTGDVFVGSFKDGHFDEGKLTIAETGESYVGKFDETGVPPTDKDGNATAGTWYDKDGNKI